MIFTAPLEQPVKAGFFNPDHYLSSMKTVSIGIYTLTYHEANIWRVSGSVKTPTTGKKITKVGTVAGCMVTDGYIKRNNPIRLIRDGIVIYSGEMTALKRFKDDASEVKSGFDCGVSIKNFNDMNMGDVIESYEKREVKKKTT